MLAACRKCCRCFVIGEFCGRCIHARSKISIAGISWCIPSGTRKKGQGAHAKIDSWVLIFRGGNRKCGTVATWRVCNSAFVTCSDGQAQERVVSTICGSRTMTSGWPINVFPSFVRARILLVNGVVFAGSGVPKDTLYTSLIVLVPGMSRRAVYTEVGSFSVRKSGDCDWRRARKDSEREI